MKIYYPALLFILPLFLTGCIIDDRSDCDDDPRLILRFEYSDAEGRDVYDGRIGKIDAILFDEHLNFYYWHSLSGEDVQRRMTQLTVSPGDYYIVCWANGYSVESSAIVDNGFPSARIYHDYSSTYTDPLHYAPDIRNTRTRTSTRADEENDDYSVFRVSVPKGEDKEHTMAFMSAHRTINVYIRGLEEIGDTGREYPRVTFTSLVPYYDFALSYNIADALVDYTSPTTLKVRDEREYAYTSLHVPHFDNENDIDIIITRPEVTGFRDVISLQEFLEKENIILYEGDNRSLDIEIIYDKDGTLVEIKLRNWDVIEVDPNKD